MATNPGTVLQVVCNFNMCNLYIGCQYQVIKKVKKKRKADLPYQSFLQDEIGNTHIFFGLIHRLIISGKKPKNNKKAC